MTNYPEPTDKQIAEALGPIPQMTFEEFVEWTEIREHPLLDQPRLTKALIVMRVVELMKEKRGTYYFAAAIRITNEIVAEDQAKTNEPNSTPLPSWS
jgi:hypothetical protein